jgi:ATP-dependent Clp protease protease subunit
MSTLVPYVIKETPKGERGMDIFSRLLEDRIIMVNGPVDTGMATIVVAQLLFLESEGDGEINMFIDSPGGSVVAGMSIIDTMNFIKPAVSTTIVGQGASMGSLIATSGCKGRRYMLPNSRHMIHQPLGGYSGQATDAEIHVNELVRWKKVLTNIYVEATGKDFETLKEDMERDFFMVPQEAVDYGLADEVIAHRG